MSGIHMAAFGSHFYSRLFFVSGDNRMTEKIKIACGVEYDGQGFYGFQTQRQEPTVQACLEKALSQVADEPVTVVCAGRTDTGVSARGQVIHFETTALRSARSWVLGGNSALPGGIALLWAKAVPADFHARFSATARRYRYHILNRWVRPAMDRGHLTWVMKPLDEQRMHEAAQILVGEHDFSAFRAAGCQSRTPMREVFHIGVSRKGNQVLIDIQANAFLHHMVRNIAGALIPIGTGERPVSWLAEVLTGRDRKKAGITAPAEGLVFEGVSYPAVYGIPQAPVDFQHDAGEPLGSDVASARSSRDSAESFIVKPTASGDHG